VASDGNTDFLFVIAGTIVFFMQIGFAMLCAGSVRKKNAQNTMLKNILDCCGAAIAWFCVGYGFAFGGQYDDDNTGGKTFIGSDNFFNTGNFEYGFWFFQYTLAAVTVTIVGGALAERCQMLAFLQYSCYLTAFVYPTVVHAVWSKNGFLSSTNIDPFLDSGMIDFAGSGVVHLTGGTTALIATWVLGSRRGRFFDIHTGKALDVPSKIKGHSISLQLLGTMCLWFGWYGFNAGSALMVPVLENRGKLAARAAVNTSLSAAAGGITTLFANLYLNERTTGEYTFDLVVTMNGVLSGLVAISGCCAITEGWAAVIIGIVAGWVYLWGLSFLIRYRIDDAVNAIPIHMFNGAWGVVATGFFASPGPMEMAYGNTDRVGWLYELGNGQTGANLLACQIIGLVFIISWTFVTTILFFMFLNFMGWFRTESVQELVGLDVSYHGTHEASYNNNDSEEMKVEYSDLYDKYKSTSNRNNRTEELQDPNVLRLTAE